MEDNFTRQIEEIEALSSIYGEDWVSEDEITRSFSMRIVENKISVILYITLPHNYPSESPPVYQLSAPDLSKMDKQCIGLKLDEVYLSNIGETVIFQWIEKIREFLQDKKIDKDICLDTYNEGISDIMSQFQNYGTSFSSSGLPSTITHGEVISDRKSDFQGHASRVTSVECVQKVLYQLHENKKYSRATHNIYAYRIFNEDKKAIIQDFEDDGENQAGKRLLHLLQILNIQNVLVIVSRWYGGIQLGPERFRHINNAARQALEAAEFIPEINSGKKKK